MPTNHFRLQTRWNLDCTPQEIAEVLEDVLTEPVRFARISPAVFRDVTVIAPGGAHGEGCVLDVRTAGWLPYTIDWSIRLVEAVPMRRYVQRAWGDFEGEATWTVTETRRGVEVTLDWRVTVHKPLIRWTAWLLKPLFAANHRWAMARGLADLRAELQWRRLPAAA